MKLVKLRTADGVRVVSHRKLITLARHAPAPSKLIVLSSFIFLLSIHHSLFSGVCPSNHLISNCSAFSYGCQNRTCIFYLTPGQGFRNLTSCKNNCGLFKCEASEKKCLPTSGSGMSEAVCNYITICFILI